MTSQSSVLVSCDENAVFRFSSASFFKIYRRILKTERVAAKDVELHFVRSASMKRLNKKFRGKNKATDVLSFPSAKSVILGTIIIDIDTATAQAKDFGHSRLQEIRELFVHGVYHLLGYDHEKAKEARLMAKKEIQANRWWTSKA